MEDQIRQTDNGAKGAISTYGDLIDKRIPTKVLDYLLERVKEDPDDLILAEALRGELIDMIRKLQHYCQLMTENRDALEAAAQNEEKV